MLGRLRLRVRSVLPTALRILASWKLSVISMVTAAVYYVFLTIWARKSAPTVVENIAGLLPFYVVYVLLLANTCVCLWRRLPGLLRDVASRPMGKRFPPRWEAQLRGGEESARRLMRRQGLRIVRQSDGRLWGRRQRFSALGTFLFHGSLFVIALGFMSTGLMRSEQRVWVAEGERYSGAEEQVVGGAPPGAIALAAPRLSFTVRDVKPEFWRDQLLFTELEAQLSVDGEHYTTEINRPLWFGFSTFLRLSGFGYAPRYVLHGARGEELTSQFVKMRVFPPGQRDHFRPGGMPHRVYLEVLPDAPDGGRRTESLNLSRPLLNVDVYRGKLAVASAALRLGEVLNIDDLALSFPEISYWGEFTILRDPGAPLLLFGYLLAALGLALKVRGRRAEMTWSVGTDGRGTMCGWGPVLPPDEGEEA